MSTENKPSGTDKSDKPNELEAGSKKTSSSVPLFLFVFAVPLILLIVARLIWG